LLLIAQKCGLFNFVDGAEGDHSGGAVMGVIEDTRYMNPYTFARLRGRWNGINPLWDNQEFEGCINLSQREIKGRFLLVRPDLAAVQACLVVTNVIG